MAEETQIQSDQIHLQNQFLAHRKPISGLKLICIHDEVLVTCG